MDGVTQQSTHRGTVMHMNNLDAWMKRRSWHVGKEEKDEKKKGKSDFSSLSFGAATMAFGLTATQ